MKSGLIDQVQVRVLFQAPVQSIKTQSEGTQDSPSCRELSHLTFVSHNSVMRKTGYTLAVMTLRQNVDGFEKYIDVKIDQNM